MIGGIHRNRKIFLSITVIVILVVCMLGLNYWYKLLIKKNYYRHTLSNLILDYVLSPSKDTTLIDNMLFEDNLKALYSRQVELIELKIVENLIDQDDWKRALIRLKSIIEDKTNHEMTVSFAILLWSNLVLEHYKSLDIGYMEQSLQYLEYFVNTEQLFFGIGTLMKVLFYLETKQNILATKYINDILNLDNFSTFIKDQARTLQNKI
jgi:hypothetical protein